MRTCGVLMAIALLSGTALGAAQRLERTGRLGGLSVPPGIVVSPAAPDGHLFFEARTACFPTPSSPRLFDPIERCRWPISRRSPSSPDTKTRDHDAVDLPR